MTFKKTLNESNNYLVHAKTYADQILKFMKKSDWNAAGGIARSFMDYVNSSIPDLDTAVHSSLIKAGLDKPKKTLIDIKKIAEVIKKIK